MRTHGNLGLLVAAILGVLGYTGGCSNNPTHYPPPGGEGGAFPIGGTLGGTGGYTASGMGGQGEGGRGMGGEVILGSGGTGIDGIGGQGAGGDNHQPCVQLATRAACDASTACHSVFFDPHNCSCAGAGCCAQFNHCADGNGAACYGGVSCALAPPFCEGAFVVAYRNDCFEGCVQAADCAPVCTPGADQTCNDNPIISSLHGHCTNAGQCVCGTGFVFNPNTGRCL